ncbi:MAG: GNAT family N-acetyltransferase [Vicinamibacterales bacterium]
MTDLRPGSANSALLIRDAVLPADLADIRRLWLEYLTWGNNEMQARHGVHPHSPREAVDEDIRSISKFQPPEGRLVVATIDGRVRGVGSLRTIGASVAEVKRMYVDPAARGCGAGRAILDALVAAARKADYRTVRLDSPDFMTDAHALYRRAGFIECEPYAESEIPESFRPYLCFMELTL